MDSKRASLCALVLLAAGASSRSADQLPGVTVEAERQRAQLRHDVDVFVTSAITLSSADDQTVERWTYKPICPMVAGLTKIQGEYVLGRISQIAKGAGAPLASANCKSPNLYVIVTSTPEELIKRLEMRKEVFNREASARQLAEFEKPRPVRTWYNVGTVNLDGTMVIEMLDTSSTRSRRFTNEPVYNQMPSQYGSRLNASTVTHDMLSVIEIVDKRQTGGLDMQQLADYVAVAGLAQIDLDKDFGAAPTILTVFTAPAGSKSPGMTPWDAALLHALYGVSRSSTLALSDIEGRVFAFVSMPLQ